MAAASCPAGAAGALCPCPVGAAGMAPEGISRRGLPRAGRTASGAAPAGAEGAAAAAGAAGVEEAVGVAGVVAGAAGVVGATPVICRSRIAGRRATISGGAVRRGRTAAGRARCTEAEAEAGTGFAAEEALVSGPAASAPSRAAGAAEAVGAAGAAPPPAFATFAARCTGGVAFGRTVRTVFAAGSSPAAAPATPPGSPSASGRAARSSSGPPGEAERGTPGRATPWMRPTGADGMTAWPNSPPKVGFCHEASRDRNRSPSLTPIEDRATVTAGGATRRHPPSQSEPPEPEPPEAEAPTSAAAPAPTSAEAPASAPEPATGPVSASATPAPGPSVRRRSQSPNPTRSPAFVDAGVDPRYLPHPLLTLRVGEVENVLTLPMEVVGDVRDLLPQPGKRVRHDSPRRPPERSTSNEPWQSGQVTAAWVWPSLLIRR